MTSLVQKKITDFYCSAVEFASAQYHYDRLWRSALLWFKIKKFKLMYHRVRHESSLLNGDFPAGWYEFGATLSPSHVLHHVTYELILRNRNHDVVHLQTLGYKQLSIHEIEVFDLMSATDYLSALFTKEEFALAAAQGGDV